jgi:hypothetical protein
MSVERKRRDGRQARREKLRRADVDDYGGRRSSKVCVRARGKKGLVARRRRETPGVATGRAVRLQGRLVQFERHPGSPRKGVDMTLRSDRPAKRRPRSRWSDENGGLSTGAEDEGEDEDDGRWGRRERRRGRQTNRWSAAVSLFLDRRVLLLAQPKLLPRFLRSDAIITPGYCQISHFPLISGWPPFATPAANDTPGILLQMGNSHPPN